MNLSAFFAIGAGAACGAWLRWGLGALLNAAFPLLPMGTLAANWLGGLLMGVVLGIIHSWPAIPPAMQLLLTTGFLGGLTTFSTFSAEAFHLVQTGAWGWLSLHMGLHVFGSLALTWGGYTLFNALHG